MARHVLWIGGMRCALQSEIPESKLLDLAHRADRRIKQQKACYPNMRIERLLLLTLIETYAELDKLTEKSLQNKASNTSVLPEDLLALQREQRQLKQLLQAYEARSLALEAMLLDKEQQLSLQHWEEKKPEDVPEAETSMKRRSKRKQPRNKKSEVTWQQGSLFEAGEMTCLPLLLGSEAQGRSPQNQEYIAGHASACLEENADFEAKDPLPRQLEDASALALSSQLKEHEALQAEETKTDMVSRNWRAQLLATVPLQKKEIQRKKDDKSRRLS